MNPLLKRLGFRPDDRVVIIHADDLGMCQATIPAVAELFAAGLVSSAATMVPCAWFPAVAAYARATPSADIGVHATLTSEWDAYRWGPLSTRDPASGLLDDEGYFHRTTPAVQERARPDAVAAELHDQINRALAHGIDVTHLDSHMGSAFAPHFLLAYLAAAAHARVPPLVPRLSEERMREMGMPEEMIAFARNIVPQLEAQGVVMVDHLIGMPLDRHEDRVETAKQLLGSLTPGLTYVIIHPAIDTPELRAIEGDWRARVADYQAFCSAELRAWVQDQGIHVIGWRPIRDVLRGA
ncbi:MAG: polysaccharide deacetylase family protein [Roseiflexus sp.]